MTPSTAPSPTSRSRYADQNEKDYQAVVDAVQSGRLEAQIGL